ncbi:MAG: hypothetical protein JO025_14995 [Verrucomicrobia bacterium]|nr:hypothetical protein [Verrucomicrobiota bacterium]
MQQIAKSGKVRIEARSLVAELQELLQDRMEMMREQQRLLYLYNVAIESAKIGLADSHFPQRIL